MKTTLRRLAIPVSALTLSVAGSLLATAPAHASGYTTSDICGSGYQTVRSYNVSYQTVTGAYRKLGTVYLGYNSGNGYNCAYTLKDAALAENNFWGYPTRTGVKLLTENSTWATDYGNYKYYAGPVYRYGRDRCTKLVADVSNNSGISAHFASGWIACG